MIYRTSIGLDVHARSIAAEIGDFSRFPSAPAFMSYLGLVPSEDSSGGKVERGGRWGEPRIGYAQPSGHARY